VSGYVPLLPYMEQDSIYRQFTRINFSTKSLGPPTYPSYDQTPGNWIASENRIKILTCPSDDMYEAANRGTGTVAICDQVQEGSTNGTGSVTIWYWSDVDEVVAGHPAKLHGLTNCLGMAGGIGAAPAGDGWSKWEGIFTNRSETTLPVITSADGTANTILIGEHIGERPELSIVANPPSTLTVVFAWVGVFSFPSAWGIPDADGVNGQKWYMYSSKHTGVINFAYADGSVRALRKHVQPSANPRPYRMLTAFKDGESWDSSGIQ